jgi:hypothetical protein
MLHVDDPSSVSSTAPAQSRQEGPITHELGITFPSNKPSHIIRYPIYSLIPCHQP